MKLADEALFAAKTWVNEAFVHGRYSVAAYDAERAFESALLSLASKAV